MIDRTKSSIDFIKLQAWTFTDSIRLGTYGCAEIDSVCLQILHVETLPPERWLYTMDCPGVVESEPYRHGWASSKDEAIAMLMLWVRTWRLQSQV